MAWIIAILLAAAVAICGMLYISSLLGKFIMDFLEMVTRRKVPETYYLVVSTIFALYTFILLMSIATFILR